MSDTLLVTGASGHLGQRVLTHLLDTLKIPGERIVAVSRKPEALSDWTTRGVVARAGDFDDPSSLRAAFGGVDRLLLISTDSLHQPGQRLAQHKAAVSAAVEAGVKHVVYTSMPNPQNSLVLFAPDHAGTEAALAGSALPGWTVLRNHWYSETLFFALPPILASGKWYTAAGEGKTPYIARDDLARAAATALVGGHGKLTFTLGGRKAYSVKEVADLVGRTVGRTIEVVPISVQMLAANLAGLGLPPPLPNTFASIEAAVAAGQFDSVADDFKKLVGNDPLPFEQWLLANKLALEKSAHT